MSASGRICGQGCRQKSDFSEVTTVSYTLC